MANRKDVIVYSLKELHEMDLMIDKYCIWMGEDAVVINGVDSGEITKRQLFYYPCRIDAAVFIFCRRGKINASINLKTYEISENMAIIMPPQTIIQVHYTDDLDIQGMIVSSDFIRNINFDSKVIMPLYLQTRNNCVIKFGDMDMDELNSYYALFKKTLSLPDNHFNINTARSLITAAIYRIGDMFDSYAKPTNETYGNSRQVMLFEQFMKLLEEYHTSERSVKFYADKLFLTPKHVSKVIADVSGKSAADWIDDFVILEAKNLLKYPNLTIQEVAYCLNFTTQSVFGKYFKHKTGLSPGEYKAS